MIINVTDEKCKGSLGNLTKNALFTVYFIISYIICHIRSHDNGIVTVSENQLCSQCQLGTICVIHWCELKITAHCLKYDLY